MNTDPVAAHYGSTGIAERVLAALREAKGADAPVTPDNLAPFDHFHGRGLVATQEIADPAPGSLAVAGKRRDADPGALLIQPPSDTQYRMNYPEPWLGGNWKLRDIIEYQLIAWDSCLYNAALHRAETDRLAIVRHPRILPWPATTPWQRRAASLSHLRATLFANAVHLSGERSLLLL